MRRFIALAALFFAASGAFAAIPAGSVMKAHLARRAGDYAAATEHLRAALKADPESVELRVKLVRFLMLFGEPDQGIAIVDDGLKLHPDNPELNLERAKTLILAGRNREAAEAALKSAEKGGGDRAYALSVRLFSNVQENDKALKVAEMWFAAKPAAPADAHLERGNVYFRMGDAEKAASDYSKVLEQNPDHQQALEGMAQIAAQKGNRADAIRFFERLVKQNPHNFMARVSMANVYMEDRKEAEAAAILDEAEKWAGNDVNARLKLGLLFLQIDAPQKALRNLEAIPDQSRDDRVRFFIGLSQLEMDRFDEAIRSFDAVRPESSLYDEMVIRRAAAMRSSGKAGEAVESLKEYLKKTPASAQAAITLSSVLQGMERHREGADVLEEFLAVNKDAKETMVFFNLGVLYEKLGNWQKSIEWMRKVLEIAPDDAHALNYIAYTWAERGMNLEEAEGMVKRALKTLPKNGFIVDSLGWIYFKQGRFSEAAMELEKAVGLSPDDAIIWEHLGDARMKAGDREGAKKAYEKVMSLAPGNKTAPQKLEELK